MNRREVYKKYLKSEWWLTRRERALELAGRKCQKCGRTTKLEVHHLSYERLGAELDEDLIVLCGPHHEAEHKIVRKKSKKKREMYRSVVINKDELIEKHWKTVLKQRIKIQDLEYENRKLRERIKNLENSNSHNAS